MTYGAPADPPPTSGEEPPAGAQDEAPPPADQPPAPIPTISFTAPHADEHTHPADDPADEAVPPTWVAPLLADLIDALRPPAPPTADAPPSPPPRPEPRYNTVEDWVSDWLAPMIVRRHGPEFHWCPQWWLHSEALSRLTCLWSAWEAAYAESDLAMLSWYHEHLDHHLPVLCSSHGPFHNCSNDQGHNRSPGIVLQHAPIPDTFWDTGAVDGYP